ncbi:MAG: hypothetical protein ACJAZ2_002006 [Glaciecola sp.]|jgi:hypothetical protein
MDTGDLSENTYTAIMVEAEKFNHDLTLQFGLLSSNCSDEDDFIKQPERLINSMKKYDEYDLDDIFFGNSPNRIEFQKALEKILINIEEVAKIKIEKRIYV